MGESIAKLWQTARAGISWPWLLSVPLLVAGYICGVFFFGTDSILLAPSIICLLFYVVLAQAPNFRHGWQLPRSRTVLFVLLFWAWMCLSLIWSTIPFISTIFTIVISILPVFFLASVTAHRAEQWVTVHTAALWATICGFAAWAVIQFFFLYEMYPGRIAHPFLDPNSLAGLLNIGIFPALGLFFLARGPKQTALAGLAVAVFYMALIVTQSRGGVACFAGSALIFLAFAVWRNPRGFPWQKLAFLLALAALAPLLGNIYNDGALEGNLGAGRLTNVRSMEDRFYLWGSTWEMIKDHFWLGTGLATFYFYYPRYRDPLDRSDGFFAHMDPLQYGAEMGVLAPLLFYGTLICILLRTASAMRAVPREGLAARLQIITPFCGMLALTSHAHINYHLYMPGMLIPLSCMLAYWYMATERALGDGAKRIAWQPSFKPRWAAAALLAFTVLMAGGWVARTSAATYLMGQVQKNAATDQKKAEELLALTGRVAPPSYGRYFEYEARVRVNHLWQHAKKMNKEAVRLVYEDALHYLDEADKRNPAFTSLWDMRARAHYAVNGILINDGDKLAKDLLGKVIEANPLAADSRVGLANIYVAEGDIQAAIKVLEDGAPWPRVKGRTDINFLLNLANLKRQVGDQKAFEFYYREAQKRAKAYGMTAQ